MKKHIFLILIVILLLITGISFIVINNIFNNKGNNDEIAKILNSNFVFQDSIAVGSGYKGLYFFKDDGTFIFNNERFINENNQFLEQYGTWSYKNNILNLVILNEKIAINGTVKEDVVFGNVLENYEVVERKTNKKLKYVLELIKNDGEYIKADNLILYKVGTINDSELAKIFK